MTDADRLCALIQAHLQRYPLARLQDVYRLLHHAAFGPGHSVVSKKAAREILEQESARVEPDRLLMLVESVHPDGAIVRLHVRPYLAYRAAVNLLLDAWVHSADQVRGNAAQLAAWWDLFVKEARPGGTWAGRFDLRELELFGKIRATEEWPVMPHSPAYMTAYHPLYRVLTRAEAQALCDKLKAPFDIR